MTCNVYSWSWLGGGFVGKIKHDNWAFAFQNINRMCTAFEA